MKAVPPAIILLTVLVAWLNIHSHYQQVDNARTVALHEYQKKHKSIRLHVEEYLNHLYTILHVVSLIDSSGSIEHDESKKRFVESLFNSEHKKHNMVELFILDKNFDTTKTVPTSFGYALDSESSTTHPLDLDPNEYRLLERQIAQFERNSGTKAMFGGEFELGAKEPGLVYSLPTYSNDTLTGIVTGVVTSQNFREILEWGNAGDMVALINERGDVHVCVDFPDELRYALYNRIDAEGAAELFNSSMESFTIASYGSVWSKCDVVSSEQWWLLLLYRQSPLLAELRSPIHMVMPVGTILIGLLMTILVQVLRKRYEESLRFVEREKESEEKLQQLAAFPLEDPRIVLSVNLSCQVVYLNPAARVALVQSDCNRPSEQYDRLPKQLRECITKLAESEESVDAVNTLWRDRVLHWDLKRLPNNDGVHCYATDITDLVHQKRELRKLSVAVNQTKAMILMVDLKGNIEYANAHSQDVTGYEVDELLGQSVALLKSDEQDPVVTARISRRVLRGKSWNGRFRNKKKNGELYWQRTSITPIMNENDKVAHFIVVGEDISGELITQSRLNEADKWSAIGTLAAGVAHEFKNYLAGIMGNASLAVDEIDDGAGIEVARAALDQVIELSERANEVAMSLLSYSRSQPDEFEEKDLGEIITQSVTLIKKALQSRSIEITMLLAPIPKQKVSASKIQQVLLNLIINAEQAIDHTGTIDVVLKAEGENVVIAVSDTGAGIPQHRLNRIFDPFYSTKGVWGQDEVAGTGMGLWICRNIALEHGGELTATSVEGKGTTFTLTIPMTKSRPSDNALREALDHTPRAALFSLSGDIARTYRDQSTDTNFIHHVYDDITKVPIHLNEVADVAILDAKFSAKLELFNMVRLVNEASVPYVMINSGSADGQLADLFEGALAVYDEVPEIATILSLDLARGIIQPA